MPGFAHETDFLCWQMEALMTKISLRRSHGWEGLGRVSAHYKSVYLFSADDLLSWFEQKPVFSFILKGIPLKLYHKHPLLNSSRNPEISPAAQTMLSCLQKREKKYKATYAQIARDVLLGDTCKYVSNQISKVAVDFPSARGREGKKEQRNHM